MWTHPSLSKNIPSVRDKILYHRLDSKSDLYKMSVSSLNKNIIFKF